MARRHGPHVESALRELGIRLDRRGLVPLAEARRRIAAVTAFKRGKSHRIEGQRFRPTDADFLWAALLSLKDAGEFVREAARLKWRNNPRGTDNIAPVERYGDGVLPWLEAVVGKGGTPPAAPNCVVPCLMALDSPGALQLLLRLRRPRDPDPDQLGLVAKWLDAGDSKRARVLAELARTDDAGKHALEVMKRRSPRRFGTTAAGLSADDILRTLDASARVLEGDILTWPRFGPGGGHFEYHAMRLIGARQKDRWRILIEVVQGDVCDPDARWPATIQQYRYGNDIESGGRYLEDCRRLGLRVRGRDESTVTAPKVGRFHLDDAMLDELDLRPGRSCSHSVASWPTVLAIRATLAKDRSAFWNAPETVVRSMGLRKPDIIVETDAFEHVDGAGGRTPRLRRLPSAAIAYRTLAESLARSDPKLFDPGEPNTDWRLHLLRRRRGSSR